jgi:membrane-associated phospholipid phosphatase
LQVHNVAAMEFFEWIDGIDKAVFTAIQQYATASWLDNIMLLLRNAATWIPLYLFVLIWLLKNARSQVVTFIILTVVTFAFCDFVSASVLKPFVGRLRPCYDVEVASTVRGLIGCGGRFSFPSSHAANHFGLAAFWFFAILHIKGKRWHWLWLWAAVICFAQVYVGKHYPMDVLGGAFLGTMAGMAAAMVFKHWQPNWLRHQKNAKWAQTSY